MTDDELHQAVLVELRRLAVDGVAPGSDAWGDLRDKALPSWTRIFGRLRISYTVLVQEAGLQSSPRKGGGGFVPLAPPPSNEEIDAMLKEFFLR